MHIKTSVAFLALMLLLSTHPLQAQIDAHAIIKERNIPCHEMAYTSSLLIMEFHQKQQLDSLESVMFAWDEHCGMQEPLMRFMALYLIQTNNFYEDWYPENLAMMLEDYRTAQNTEYFQNYYYDYTLWQYQPISTGFNSYTQQLAEQLKQYQDLSAAEQYLVEHYSHNFREARRIGRSKAFRSSALASALKDRDNEISRGPLGFIGVSAGMWKPTGNLSALGTAPELTLSFEGQLSRFLLNGHFGYVFSGTQQTYVVPFGSKTYEMAFSRGYSAGFDLGLEAMSNQRTSLFIMPGIAARSIMSSEVQSVSTIPFSKNSWSFSPSLGLYVRHRYSTYGFFGLQAKYNLVNFDNPGGTDLSGNVFTLGVIFGGYQ